MKDKKEIKTDKLCFKYNCNCKLCPKNAKCEEEFKKEVCTKNHMSK